NNTKNNTKNIYSVEPSSTMPELFEKVWKTYPKKTNKKKAREQFLKKFKTEEDLEPFKKGYKDYLAYIKLNDWYHPQELFRWIRDDRYNDEYDLSQKNKHPAYSKAPVRQEQLPNWTGMQEDVPLSPEELAELERQKQELLGE
ncbi:helix-turn-helix domain-containing protein, partial [Enterococcus faecalis]